MKTILLICVLLSACVPLAETYDSELCGGDKVIHVGHYNSTAVCVRASDGVLYLPVKSK